MRNITYSEADVLEVIGKLYAAAGNMMRWPEALQPLNELTRSSLVLLRRFDSRTKSETGLLGAPRDLDTRVVYAEYYGNLNPWIRNARLHVPGSVLTSQELLADSELRKTEFHADFLVPRKWLHSINATFSSENQVSFGLSLLGMGARGPYTQEEAILLRKLVPHVHQALRLFKRMAGILAGKEALGNAIDKLPIGIILTDGEGKVLAVNRPAQAIIDQEDGLSIDREGQLIAAQSKQTAGLQRLVGGVTQTAQGKGIDPGGVVELQRPSGLRPLSLLVAPLPEYQFGIPESQAYLEGNTLCEKTAFAAVFVSDPEQRVETPTQMLIRLYRLTPAEARVASLLVQGQSVKEVAEELRVSVATTRTHLRRILSKTDTRRQGELISLLLSGVGVVQPS